ncbi:DivIVA domain-containing protein, partial [Kitasatospora sp. NPDC056783]|uniref:DivIVA domain-containing protein n=1 Tax=Kitasatospora sp. NPDC056783 TaxID=3345943 RepID=UPI0036BDC1DB
MSTPPEFRGFDLVRRGYDREQVDGYLAALAQAAPVPPAPAFQVRWRGYDRE